MSLPQRLLFYFRYALRSLRREGVRTLLAGLSIFFGVVSLVSMQSLSGYLLHGALFNERLQFGGDAVINAPTPGDPFTAADLAQIDQWQQDDLIRKYVVTAERSFSYLRKVDNGRVIFVMRAVGIDPATYGLLGPLTLSEPRGQTPADVLTSPTDILMTRDLAEPAGIGVGDTVVLSGVDLPPLRLTVAGIVSGAPDQRGRRLYYTLDTARYIEGRDEVVTNASILWGDAPDAEQTLIESPLSVFVARSHDRQAAESASTALFDLMLKGAGVLGLLVGGIGVANTLQVMLARRKVEIAVLKTVGGQRGMLLILIALETGILGLVSSFSGAVAGSYLGGVLLDMLGAAGTFLFTWSPDWGMIAGGTLAGTLTAIVFGLQAIIALSATRPIELLRDSSAPAASGLRLWLTRALLFGLLLVVEGVLVGVVLGSVPEGILYVVGGGVLLLLLRVLFGAVLWVVLRLPAPPVPLLRLAHANLKRRTGQASLIVIALFAGVFSVTFAAITIASAQREVQDQRADDGGYNLMVQTAIEEVPAVQDAFLEQGVPSFYTNYQAEGTVNGEPMRIEGREDPATNADITLQTPWRGADDEALLPDRYRDIYAEGTRLTLTADRTREVTVVGYYEVNTATLGIFGIYVDPGVVVTPATAQAVGASRTVAMVFAAVPTAQVERVADVTGRAAADALIFSKVALNDVMMGVYQSLFSFAISVAGLAFVAGAVLIANSAGLTVVERRREMGVLKAVGYSAREVLGVLVGEYAFLGWFAGVFGVIAVYIMVTIIVTAQPGAPLTVDPLIVAVMVAFTVGIAMVSAAVVAWSPTHVRPLEVLRYE